MVQDLLGSCPGHQNLTVVRIESLAEWFQRKCEKVTMTDDKRPCLVAISKAFDQLNLKPRTLQGISIKKNLLYNNLLVLVK